MCSSRWLEGNEIYCWGLERDLRTVGTSDIRKHLYRIQAMTWRGWVVWALGTSSSYEFVSIFLGSKGSALPAFKRMTHYFSRNDTIDIVAAVCFNMYTVYTQICAYQSLYCLVSGFICFFLWWSRQHVYILYTYNVCIFKYVYIYIYIFFFEKAKRISFTKKNMWMPDKPSHQSSSKWNIFHAQLSTLRVLARWISWVRSSLAWPCATCASSILGINVNTPPSSVVLTKRRTSWRTMRARRLGTGKRGLKWAVF